MKTALVFNTVSGFARQMRASEFEKLYAGNPDLKITPAHPDELKNLSAASPDDGLPLVFHRTYFRMGRTQRVEAHWAKPAGFGNRDHLLEPAQQQTLEDGVRAGKSILLSLNLPLTSHPVSFAHMKEKGAKLFENWVTGNRGNFITVSVRSARQAVETIKQVSAMGARLSQTVFAMHRGAVVPYDNFYLGDRRSKMVQLFNAMQEGRAGVPLGENRVIGFPRLFAYVPTGASSAAPAKNGFKGSLLNQRTGKPFATNLVFASREETLASDPYRILESEVAGGQAQYVLASPGVAKPQEPDAWKMLLLVIHDIKAQTMPLDEEARQKLLAHAQRNGYDTRVIEKSLGTTSFEDQPSEPSL